MEKYVNSGKMVSHVGEAITVICIASDNEKAHFLANAANEFDYDYMAEADKTCTVVFNPQNVNRDRFVEVLQGISDLCDELNVAKKLFFRGKTCDELDQVQPSLAESVAVEFDPNNTSFEELNLLHGLVGVITEAGEMADVLLHRMKVGQFDNVNAMEESGDVAWYLARILRGLGSDFPAMQKMNINKLRGRHGTAFDVFRDANRDLAEERKKLEADAAPLFDRKAHEERMDWDGKYRHDTEVSEQMKSDLGPFDYQTVEKTVMTPPLDSIPPRTRNDPPLPADSLSVGSMKNGGENLGDTEDDRG